MSTRRYVAGVIAVVALAIVAVAWFWSTRAPQTATPQVVVVLSGTTVVAAVILAIRHMSVTDIFELLWDLIAGFVSILVSILGAILQGIWKAILSLFDLD